MTHSRKLVGVAAAGLLSLALTACGGGNSSNSGGEQTAAGATAAAGTIQVASTDLGDTLVSADGLTLYLFEKDANGKSSCSGDCASNWPPLTVNGTAVAGDGVDAGKLGATAREDGTSQVTYNGHPLYMFAGDSKPGDTKGEGIDEFGAEWYAVSPDGEAIEKASEGGGGYGGGGY